MTDTRVYTKSQSAPRATDDTWVALRATRDGAPVVLPWLTALSIEGKVFQVRLGTITATVTGDVGITDTDAEACADAPLGTTIIPVYLNVQIESINGGTLPECAAKSNATASNSGAAFIPLNTKPGGPAATSTARVAAAGVTQVAAELATDTRRHFYNVAVIANDSSPLANHQFKLPPILPGVACFYLQVAGTGFGPFYWAHFDYVELATADVA